jgi:hypothetical protein
MAATPQSHRLISVGGIQLTGTGAAGDEATIGAFARGWLNSSIVKDNDGGGAGGAVRHCTWLPKAISSENGTRNFTDAANHNVCRVRAWFWRSASVTRVTTHAKMVDCQRWLAKAGIIAMRPFFPVS